MVWLWRFAEDAVSEPRQGNALPLEEEESAAIDDGPRGEDRMGTQKLAKAVADVVLGGNRKVPIVLGLSASFYILNNFLCRLWKRKNAGRVTHTVLWIGLQGLKVLSNSLEPFARQCVNVMMTHLGTVIGGRGRPSL